MGVVIVARGRVGIALYLQDDENINTFLQVKGSWESLGHPTRWGEGHFG